VSRQYSSHSSALAHPRFHPSAHCRRCRVGTASSDSPSSEVYDLLEPVRPVAERWVLLLLAERVFTAHDFLETPTGTCRIQPPLAQCLAATGPLWFKAVAAHAENVARIIGASSPYPVHVPTSLTASRMRAAQGKRLWSGVTDAEIRLTFPRMAEIGRNTIRDAVARVASRPCKTKQHSTNPTIGLERTTGR
jgi:hypothetical protein